MVRKRERGGRFNPPFYLLHIHNLNFKDGVNNFNNSDGIAEIGFCFNDGAGLCLGRMFKQQ